MSRNLLARKPVATFQHNYFVTNVPTSAWVELITATSEPFDAVEIFSATGSIILLSTGSAGQEDDNQVPYTILPGGSGILLPYNLRKGARLSAKALDITAAKGYLILNFFS